MATLHTVSGTEFILDDEDYAKLKDCTFHDRGRYVSIYFPASSHGKGDQYRVYLHKYLLNAHDCEVDHLNGNVLDYRKENLRIATRAEQIYNQASRTIYPRGVIKIASTGKFHARIQVNGEIINLGYYEKLEDAIAARKKYQVDHGIHVREHA